MAQTQRLKLVSFELCPFVERSRIALFEKGLTHELAFIDLKAKPDWFLGISPLGKVPVLLVDDRPIFESLVINELIEELYPTPRLLPTEPLERAEARAWMIFANDALMMPSYQAQVALALERPADLLEPLGVLRAAYQKLEARLGQRRGRFFLGDAFGLVDAVYAPFFRRWIAAESWGRTRLLAEFPKLAGYAEALLAHPSVAQAAIPDLGHKMRTLFRERAGK